MFGKMIVDRSQWNEQIRRELHWYRAYHELLIDWNKLAGRFNALVEKKQSSQFTASEIDSLIRLCHPDKHGGKESATKMTQRLLALKESLK